MSISKEAWRTNGHCSTAWCTRVLYGPYSGGGGVVPGVMVRHGDVVGGGCHRGTAPGVTTVALQWGLQWSYSGLTVGPTVGLQRSGPITRVNPIKHRKSPKITENQEISSKIKKFHQNSSKNGITHWSKVQLVDQNSGPDSSCLKSAAKPCFIPGF